MYIPQNCCSWEDADSQLNARKYLINFFQDEYEPQEIYRYALLPYYFHVGPVILMIQNVDTMKPSLDRYNPLFPYRVEKGIQ